MSPLPSSASPRDTRSEIVRTAALMPGPFSFETSVISVIVMFLSIALAMS